ncbi:hypothetical protein [Nitratireductor thuwali]|uniref:Uncharacterized protein n=1 Tax=Nitratireductor thuwali TaxID=2267699 RepID=A0ABY5MJ93_9HYPH|nr:hypothetical protein NTH_02348 [Nitratireductor thuwali]
MKVDRRTRSQNAFSARVDELTHAAILDGATDFQALLHRLASVYPTDLLASIDRLARRGLIPPAAAESYRLQASRNGAGSTEGRSLLPLPHPLDFEWRFTADSARELLNRTAGMTPVGGDILLFGTPGLAVEAMTLPIANRIAFLAENNVVTSRISALNEATGSPLSIAYCGGGLPIESADAVILDPPWYPDFLRPMLLAAAHACRIDGVVLISLPPDGTCASAEVNRNSAMLFAKGLGLEVLEHDIKAVCYESPFFERNSLAAEGIFPPPHWRRGDIVVFRKKQAPTRPALPASTRRKDWVEVGIGRMRLFIRANSQPFSNDPSLASIVEGDVLRSVSRRDPRRAKAQIWTTGNRIFRSDNPQLLLDAAITCSGERLNSGVQPPLWGSIAERDSIERVADQLLALAKLEALEEQGYPVVVAERNGTWRSNTTPYWSRLKATISG